METGSGRKSERAKEQFLSELQSRISQHHMQKKSGKGIHVFAEWEISIQDKESRVQVEEGKKIDVKWTTHLITDIENKWNIGGSFCLVYACVDEHTDDLNRCPCTQPCVLVSVLQLLKNTAAQKRSALKETRDQQKCVQKSYKEKAFFRGRWLLASAAHAGAHTKKDT